MEQENNTPTQRPKDPSNKVWLILGSLVFIGSAYAYQSSQQQPAPSSPIIQTPVSTPAQQQPQSTSSSSSAATQNAVPRPTTPTTNQGLSNNNYYTNSDGQSVHSPASTTNNSVPAGASAQCGDGTYSFSTHASGTCSHHGGVAYWINHP